MSESVLPISSDTDKFVGLVINPCTYMHVSEFVFC